MGKKIKRYEKGVRFVCCEICRSNIPIDFFIDRDDLIFCESCATEYLVKSLKPVRISMIDQDYYGNFFDEEVFN